MPGGTRSYELARRLVDMGHTVSILTTWRGTTRESGWRQETIDGISVHWLPVQYSNHMDYRRRLRAFGEFALRAGLRGKTIDCDIVFATSTPLTVAIPAVYTAKQHGVPMVFEVRDLWPELPIAMGAIRNPLAKSLAKRLELFAYKHAERIIALSPGMAAGIAKTGYPSEKIEIIPNSADLERFSASLSDGQRFFAKFPELQSKPFLLYAGTLGKINGVSYLVDLAAEMAVLDCDLNFVVIGDGADKEKIVCAAKGRDVWLRNFFLLAPQSKDEIADAFAAATIVSSLFIDLPEMQANSANKFFDGLASGTPVCINYGGWHEELLTDNECGFRISRDPRAAATQIFEKKRNREWLIKAGQQARLLAQREFSRETMAAKLEENLSLALGCQIL